MATTSIPLGLSFIPLSKLQYMLFRLLETSRPIAQLSVRTSISSTELVATWVSIRTVLKNMLAATSPLKLLHHLNTMARLQSFLSFHTQSTALHPGVIQPHGILTPPSGRQAH
ncbi:uncharacterized protein A1O9_04860 [Exophiala aquamarina CBS 119918]|uniref:Uncharacterized protein n=1 Tax=Exophiala aquamarina CBS 119918 TaxID=1182545 RepID=A0A072PWN4_9EURO|nr:uncharacterized protein A1O9_04860 [Exophiala aquamarina CBS 119918]KEF60010.1 hypothetical protein A1O9_04860 [Exophiala aquamarina CBS 119918]